MLPRLYIDLDGVIFDFDRHYQELFGAEPRLVSDKVLWDNINTVPTFFRDLPLCENAAEFFELVRHLNPVILTACPKSDYARVAGAKRAAVREHLGTDVIVLPVNGGVNKALFMHAEGDILIDDHPRNIRAWRAVGGSGILHRNFDLTVWALRDEMEDSAGLGAWPVEAGAPDGATTTPSVVPGLSRETLARSAYETGLQDGTILGLNHAAELLGIDLAPGDNTVERISAHLTGAAVRHTRSD